MVRGLALLVLSGPPLALLSAALWVGMKLLDRLCRVNPPAGETGTECN